MREHFVYLDTETIPSQSPAVIAEIGGRYPVPEVDLDDIRPAANLVDPVKVAADIEKKRKKAVEDREVALAKAEAARYADYRKLCFDGATAHLACISFAIDDDEVEGFRNHALEQFDGKYSVPSYEAVLDGERQLLQAFFNMLRFRIKDAWERAGAAELPVIVGHYVGFDICMIWQRAKVLGVTPAVWWPINYNPYRQDEVVDTMTMWSGHDGRIGLATRPFRTGAAMDMDVLPIVQWLLHNWNITRTLGSPEKQKAAEATQLPALPSGPNSSAHSA